MIEKSLKSLLGLLLIFTLSSCATVKLSDDLWCLDAGKFGAECFYTISDGNKSLDKYQWDKLRVGQACSATDEPGRGFMNLKNAIEKLCADSNKCTKEQKKIVNDAIKGANVIQKKMKRAYDKVSSKFVPM